MSSTISVPSPRNNSPLLFLLSHHRGRSNSAFRRSSPCHPDRSDGVFCRCAVEGSRQNRPHSQNPHSNSPLPCMAPPLWPPYCSSLLSVACRFRGLGRAVPAKLPVVIRLTY